MDIWKLMLAIYLYPKDEYIRTTDATLDPSCISFWEWEQPPLTQQPPSALLVVVLHYFHPVPEFEKPSQRKWVKMKTKRIQILCSTMWGSLYGSHFVIDIHLWSYEIAETHSKAYLFRDVLRGDAIDPAYNMLDVCGDFLFEVCIIQTTPTNSSHWRPKRSSPRPRYQLITEKHS